METITERENGVETGKTLAYHVEATPEQATIALLMGVDDSTRSEWRWFRVGDALIFGCFPHEELYELAVNGSTPIGI